MEQFTSSHTASRGGSVKIHGARLVVIQVGLDDCGAVEDPDQGGAERSIASACLATLLMFGCLTVVRITRFCLTLQLLTSLHKVLPSCAFPCGRVNGASFKVPCAQ